jgi:hypothetical protein
MRLRLALGGQRTVALGLFGARALGLSWISLGGRRALAVPGLELLARDLGHLGLLDQAGLEQLFLERVRLGHVRCSIVGFRPIIPAVPCASPQPP